jgi:signal recognition particle subunit SEC65
MDTVIVPNNKCNLLNSFFCSISNLDDNNCNPPKLELRTNSKLAIIEFTIKEISDILKSLNISFLTRDQNNLGSDEFSSRKSFELRKNRCFAWIIMLLTLFL